MLSKSVILSFLMIFSLAALKITGQAMNPEALLDSAQARISHIKDYQVDIDIEVKVDYIRMPTKHARMYYKAPDEVSFESEEFFMLPKKGVNFSLSNMLSNKYTVIFTGYDYINQEKQFSLKIIPLTQDAEFILATLWISTEHYLVSRVDTHTRKHGSYIIDFHYDVGSLPLPVEMVITFEIDQFKAPVKFLGKEIQVDREEMHQEGSEEGRVIIRYSNYLINQWGTDDDPEETKN